MTWSSAGLTLSDEWLIRMTVSIRNILSNSGDTQGRRLSLFGGAGELALFTAKAGVAAPHPSNKAWVILGSESTSLRRQRPPKSIAKLFP